MSRSPKLLRALLPSDEYVVGCYDYPQEDCEKALDCLERLILEQKVDIVMGSSLGAFLALCLPVSIPKIIVNPCLVPSVELPKLEGEGRHAKPSQAVVDTYHSHEKDVFCHLTDGSHCFMAEEDELLGNTYRKQMEEHLAVTSLPDGHRISEAAMKVIANYIIGIA